MNNQFVMDTLFDLLNESDDLDVQELREIEAEGKFYVTTGDGTKLLIQCTVLT